MYVVLKNCRADFFEDLLFRHCLRDFIRARRVPQFPITSTNKFSPLLAAEAGPSTMTIKKKTTLQDNLICDLMKFFRLRCNGDAMVRLGLAGMETYPIFESVTSKGVYAEVQGSSRAVFRSIYHPSTKHLRLSSRKTIPKGWHYFQEYQVSSKETHDWIYRCIHKLILRIYKSNVVPKWVLKDNIKDVSVYFMNAHPSNELPRSLLTHWPNLERFRSTFADSRFLNKVATRAVRIRMKNLQYLELGISPSDLHNMLSVHPEFPFPADVRLHVDFKDRKLRILDPLHTFPQVKRLFVSLNLSDPSNCELFRKLCVITYHFGGVDSAKFKVLNHYDVMPGIYNKLRDFYKWLNYAKFFVPTEIYYHEEIEVPSIAYVHLLKQHFHMLGLEKQEGKLRKQRRVVRTFTATKEYVNFKLHHSISIILREPLI